MAEDQPTFGSDGVLAGALPTEVNASASADSAVRLAERLLAETREEIRRADAKASQWLAMIAALTMAIVATAPGRVWPEWSGSGPDRWLRLLALVVAVAAVASLVLALVPRVRGEPDAAQVAYFGHIARIGDPVTAQRCIERVATNVMPGLSAELYWLSRITMAKYRWLRAGTVLAVLAAGLALARAL